jgi:predicted DNA-binding antitoxin AbrB/MazE fold protein
MMLSTRIESIITSLNIIRINAMIQTLRAIYNNGTFLLQAPCDLPEGTEVELSVNTPQMAAPPISDPETKQRFLESLVKRMQHNPIPLNAPHLTREMLHERL